jgi:hypothetical protein
MSKVRVETDAIELAAELFDPFTARRRIVEVILHRRWAAAAAARASGRRADSTRPIRRDPEFRGKLGSRLIEHQLDQR